MIIHEEVHEEVQEKKEQRKRKLGTRRKLKAKRRKHGSSLTREEMNQRYAYITPDEDKVIDVEILSILDREDLKVIYELVMEEYKDRLPEGFDRMLWGDMMIMFNQGDTADFWDTQQDWKLISWKLHSSSGLETEEESSMALELIKFVKQQLEEFEDSNDDDTVTSTHEDEERILLIRTYIKDIQEAEKVDNLEAAQKAKIKWAIEGDENTKFYHGILNKKRVLGAILEPGRVRRRACGGGPQSERERPVINIDFPRTISELKKNELEGDISYQEIKRAVWDCGIDKSPGPDGVTFGFIRRYWSLIEKDVVAAVQHFFTSGNFPKGCNASFIALIPKIPDAKLVKDFRPISLIGSLYKIIAKILANRLVGVLGDLVSEVQSAFVADRQILDDREWVEYFFLEGSVEGEQQLKEVFPRIYALEVNKHISVAFKFEQTSLASSLRRMPRSGIKSEQWDHLLDSLEGVMLVHRMIGGVGICKWVGVNFQFFGAKE
ncbi:hypothetical protein Tco_0223322 [Tanacetum coccineum]